MLSDVHGNAVALAAVLAELEPVDLVVFGGDLTWGPMPQETLALVDAMTTPTMFVRGNADRALSEPATTPRSTWMLGINTDTQRARLAAFPETEPWQMRTGPRPSTENDTGASACRTSTGLRAAYWALLGPDVELRRTDYDLDEAARRYRATDDPLAEEMVELLFTPPRPAAIVEHAESVEFSG